MSEKKAYRVLVVMDAGGPAPPQSLARSCDLSVTHDLQEKICELIDNVLRDADIKAKKFEYDLWGVNRESKTVLESLSAKGKVCWHVAPQVEADAGKIILSLPSPSNIDLKTSPVLEKWVNGK